MRATTGRGGRGRTGADGGREAEVEVEEEEDEEEEEGGGRGRRSHAAMLCHTAGSASPRIRPAARKQPLSCS